MERLDVVMINMSGYAEWQRGVNNRNYHIIRELEASGRVGTIISVDYPPVTSRRAAKNYLENIVRPLAGGTVVRRTPVSKLTKLHEHLYVYSDVSFFMNPEKFVQRLKEQLVRLNFGDFLVWSYFPFIMPHIRTMGQKLTVFDAVDNWSEHSSYRQFKDRLKQSYQVIQDSADLIFTVAEDLVRLFGNQPNVHWIPNGVDVAHFQDPKSLVNRDIADLPRPIIGYIGVVQDRVDVSLLKFLAEKNPTKSFVIVGPVWREVDEESLRAHPNVHLLGYRAYTEAPSYIQQFDVALIPHKPTSFIASTNPMKLYEYLACGKPVVATKNSGAEQFSDVVYIASDQEDFNRKIFLALQENSPELEARRLKAVEKYSWSSAVNHMLDFVEKKLSY